MFDSMASALKKHAGKIKVKGHEEAPLMVSDGKKEELKKSSDNAPDLEDESAELMAEQREPHVPSELGPEHIDLLKKLISQLSSPGREPISLNEKTHGAMQEKMAAMMGHKK